MAPTLAEQYSGLSDEALLEIIAEGGDSYRPDALDVARREAESRRLDLSRLDGSREPAPDRPRSPRQIAFFRQFRKLLVLLGPVGLAYGLYELNASGVPVDSVLFAETYRTDDFVFQTKLFTSGTSIYARVRVPMGVILPRDKSVVLLYSPFVEEDPNPQLSLEDLPTPTIDFRLTEQEIRFRLGSREAIYDTETLEFSSYPYMQLLDQRAVPPNQQLQRR